MRRLMLPVLLLSAVGGASAAAGESSWLFYPGKYTHNPATARRVSQFAPKPYVAALPDARPYSSEYRRSRIQLRGAGGSVNDSYFVQNWSGGQGGLDAEWERFNDVWQRSVLSGGFYGGRGGSPNYGWGGPAYGRGYPGNGYGPGRGGPPGYGGWGPGGGPGGYGPGGYGPGGGPQY